MKKVSIIIPVYNVAEYLRQCLDSVLGQTYSNLEIIIINDGSTDDSGQICDDYAKKDTRIKLFHQANAGAANAKNAGLDQMTGEYVTFIDSDDYVELNWIEKMVDSLESANADVAECTFMREYTNHTEEGNPEGFLPASFTGSEYISQYLNKWTNSLFWNKLFIARLVSRVRFRKERRCIDDEFFTYKVVGAARQIIRIPNALYHYRQRRSSAVYSHDKAVQRTADALEMLKERYLWIGNRFPEFKKYYIFHDVSNLHFFANNFPFTEDLINQYRSISRFYIKESVLNHIGIASIKDSATLLKYRKSYLKSPKGNETLLLENLFN